ncbi:hypothetical protein H1V43_20835 [Streptomyces sp. PSKA54]|uniref:Uncharacterized protein n=1 Tax=Streptomyces himalayensis subsp. aureolus TaxID=2758039 RepID=A0A7W2HHB1_9ACTN|nr:hypothetical protein [Streptomyces himalayensis subsp. aureolus]
MQQVPAGSSRGGSVGRPVARAGLVAVELPVPYGDLRFAGGGGEQRFRVAVPVEVDRRGRPS